MTQIRALFAGFVALVLISSVPAAAAEWKEFSPEALAAAQEAEKPILVYSFAAWCSVCRAQNPILVKLTKEPKYKDLLVLKADFDAQKEDLRALNVRSQSTLIVYKGGKEIERSVGSTNELAIEGQLDKTL